MYVDLWSLLGNKAVLEEITIKPLGETTSDEFGNMIDSSSPEIVADVAIVEKTTNVLDIKTGSYMPRVVYDFYIPSEIVNENSLDGATIVRGKREYIIVSEPIARGYISHCVVKATEKRYV